jgi:hypothetical protein
MSDAPAMPRWRVLLTPRWVGWHLFAVVAITAMTWLGDWQFRRAESGNALSWAYTFEWPVFAVFGVVFWIKTIRDELKPAAAEGTEPAGVRLPAGVGSAAGARSAQAGQAEDDGDDPAGQEAASIELAEYNAYLARLNSEAKGHGRWHGFR